MQPSLAIKAPCGGLIQGVSACEFPSTGSGDLLSAVSPPPRAANLLTAWVGEFLFLPTQLTLMRERGLMADQILSATNQGKVHRLDGGRSGRVKCSSSNCAGLLQRCRQGQRLKI